MRSHYCGQVNADAIGTEVEVAGWVRLNIELVILGGGAAGFYIAGQHNIAIAFAVLVVFHYATTWSRIQWLLDT